MALTNVIVNGTFDISQNPDGSSPPGFAWTGTDLEGENEEHQYLGGADTNDGVAEMDGEDGATTVMQQSFDIDHPVTTTLTLESALRTTGSPLPVAGTDGFTVEILDSSGTVITSTTILPTSSTMTEFTLDVTFPTAGTYTLRLTEVGNNDSFGAIVDDIAMLVCFCRGTLIETAAGQTPVQDIKAGDLVLTEAGLKVVRWTGRRSVSPSEYLKNPKLRPVVIKAGALGTGLPESDLHVSRQHRMLVKSQIVKRMFDEEKVLVSAIKLTDLPGVFVDDQSTETEYFHLLFDEHEIVFANGAPSESLLTGPEAVKSLTPESREELEILFPEISSNDYVPKPAMFIPKGARQKKLVERHRNSGKPLYFR